MLTYPENFNLLLSNPACHRVFLATCTDNGFARILQQYQYHPAAYEKIVLISPGYVESEIARLGFRSVVWPSVFLKKQPPKVINDANRAQKLLLILQQASKETEAFHKRLRATEDKGERKATLAQYAVKLKWDGNIVLGGSAGQMAARMSANRPEEDERPSHGFVMRKLVLEEGID